MLLGFLHKRVLILLCSFLLVLQSSFAQIGALEDSVFYYRAATLKAKTDSAKLANNQLVYTFLSKALREDSAFYYPFSRLNSFSNKRVNDQTRIITWNIALDEDKNQYFGLILRKKSKKKGNNEIALYSLENTKSGNSADWEKMETSAENWFGALYYDYIPADKKGNSILLLGWRGKDRLLSQKVIEVLYFEDNVPKFGKAIIRHGSNLKHRVIFNYPAQIPFALKADRQEKRIVFDRLMPEKPEYAGNYALYIPQFTFDAYIFQKNEWTLKLDVPALMPAKERKKPQQPTGPPPPMPMR